VTVVARISVIFMGGGKGAAEFVDRLFDRLQFNQKSLVGVLVAVPLKTIVEIRFKARIVVALKRNIENRESKYKKFRHKDSTRFSFSALGNEHQRTRNLRELCETSSSGARNRPAVIA
jgi:hypothetical protein